MDADFSHNAMLMSCLQLVRIKISCGWWLKQLFLCTISVTPAQQVNTCISSLIVSKYSKHSLKTVVSGHTTFFHYCVFLKTVQSTILCTVI